MITDNKASYADQGPGTITLDRLSDADIYNSWIVDTIEPFLGKNNLEMGAGIGTIAAEMTDRGYRVDVLDPAEANLTVLQRKSSDSDSFQNVYSEPEAIPDAVSYDCVYSSNVLEHIPDDGSELIKYLRSIRVGGLIVAIVPAGGKLLYSRFDRMIGHFRRYAPRDIPRLRHLYDQDGRELHLKFHRFLNPIGAFGWLLLMKILRRTEIDTESIKASQVLLPISTLLQRANLPWGQSMLLVWRRVV